MTMRLASLAALPLLAALGWPTSSPGAPTADVSAVEADNCLLADVLQDKKGQLQELLRLARAQGVRLTGPEIEALGLGPGSPRKLTEANHAPGFALEPEAADEPEEAHEPEAALEHEAAHEPEEAHEPEAALEPEAAHEPEEAHEPEAALEHEAAHEHESGHAGGGGDAEEAHVGEGEEAHSHAGGGHLAGGEHEGGEHEGEHGEEEEVHFESWDNDTSLMLLGLISFVMILFYLTNWPDDDIRFYSWQITSITISIFCAVLTFNGFNQLIRGTFETRDNGIIMCVLHFVHCFLYLALMHFATGWESGLIGSSEVDDALVPEVAWVYADALQCTNDTLVEETELSKIRAVARGDQEATRSVLEFSQGGTVKMEVPVQKKQHRLIRRRRRTKALAMLLAHMAGFAAIFSGTSLQRYFHDHIHTGFSKFVCWAPLIINQVVIQVAFRISKGVRDKTVKMRRAKTLEKEWDDRDQEKKALEGLNLVEELMTEEVVESENDVSSLSMSYLFVNVLRLLLTDELPNEAAEEPEDWKPEFFRHAFALYAIGVVLVLLACAQAIAMQKLTWPVFRDPSALRILNTILNATAMCFAWCALWATHWTVEWWCTQHDLHPHRILQKVVIAFVLTAFAACMVFGVDKIDDALEQAVAAKAAPGDGTAAAASAAPGEAVVAPGDGEADAEAREPLAGPKSQEESHEAHSAHQLAREMIRIIVTSLGILVGFSWEHCFDGGVESVAEKADEPLRIYFQLVLGILVCILVLPAWRKHILQKVMLMEEMRDREEHASDPKHISSKSSNDDSEGEKLLE